MSFQATDFRMEGMCCWSAGLDRLGGRSAAVNSSEEPNTGARFSGSVRELILEVFQRWEGASPKTSVMCSEKEKFSI